MADVPGWAYVVGAPLWAATVVYVIRTTKDWPGIMARWNERQRDRAQIDGDLYERLAHRVEILEAKVAVCEEERDGWRSRAIAAEATLMGRGEAHQEAQRIVSAEREADAVVRGKGRKK